MSATTEFDQQAAGEQPERKTEPLVMVPVIEEYLTVNKQLIETGKVIISKSVTEHNETIDIPLIQESVHVARVPVNQYVEEMPTTRYEGDTMIIPVLREVIVKRILLVEELHVTKQQEQSTQTQNITLRKEHIHIERSTGESGNQEIV